MAASSILFGSIFLPGMAAQTSTAPLGTPDASSSVGGAHETAVVLPSFNVSSTQANPYNAVSAVSAVRVNTPLLDTPSSISVITREIIDDLVPTRVFDVARYAAGIQDGRGLQFQERMIIRGFEANGGRVVDGFLQLGAPVDNFDEALIDRVEISKGPNAILTPAGAAGGAINIITKSPSFGASVESVTALIGNFDAQKLTIDATGPLSAGGSLAYRLVGSVQDTNRYISDAKLKRETLAPMLSWRISDRTTLTSKLLLTHQWIYRDPTLILDPNDSASTKNPTLAPGFSTTSLNGAQPWSHVGTNTADLYEQLTTSFNDHVSLRVAGNGRWYDEEDNQDFISTPSFSNRYNPMTGILTQNQTWALQTPGTPYNAVTNPYVPTASPYYNPSAIPHYEQYGWTRATTANLQADLAANYSFGWISSQTVGGYALAHWTSYTRQRQSNPTSNNQLPTDGSALTYLPAINLNSPDARYIIDPANIPITTNNESLATNQEFYLTERVGFFNDRLFLSAGGLHYKTYTTQSNLLTGAVPVPLDSSRNMFSLGALVKVTKEISVYYSHSTNASPSIVNNAPLWSSGIQDEFGAKSEFFDQRLSITAAYFKIHVTNFSTPNPAYQLDQTQPQSILGDYGDHGLEFELRGAVTKNLSLVASYTDMRLRDALGRMIRGVADHFGAFLIDYRFTSGPMNNLALNLGISASGKRAGDAPSAGFTALGVVEQVSFYLPNSYYATIGASYRVNPHVYIRANIDNPLDDKDFVAVSGGRISNTGLAFATGLNAKLSVTYGF